MKKKLIFALFLLPLILVSCNNKTVDSNFISSERFGLEGNADLDQVEKKDSSQVLAILKKAAIISKYSYETTVNVSGIESHFINYFSPTAFYEDNDVSSLSFGYGEEKGTKAVFKYYLSEDKKTVNNSIYEYEGTSGDIKKLTGLYSSLSVANIGMLKTSMSDFSASYVSGNKFILTDLNTASVFQYMTTFGSSLINIMNGVYINIINFDTTEFNVIVDCGSYGTIESAFKPILGESITDVVEKGIALGTVKGVDSYSDVDRFLSQASTNNYVIEGIKMHEVNGDTNPGYKVHLTNSYFYVEYLGDQGKNYDNFGYAFLKKGQKITVKTKQKDGSFKDEIVGPLNYDACFEFNKGQDGTFYFDLFKGPVEGDNQKYEEVSELPETGDASILYIVSNKQTGEKEVYEWIKVDGDKYGWSRYSSWYDNVGDFAINDASATFYLSGTSGLTELGGYFFEKNLSKENAYYSKEVDILSMLANGLFGWGFQPTTTWISYVKNSFLEITDKDADGNINKANLGLGVQASVNGGENKIQEIFYTYDFTEKGNVKEVEDFFTNSGVELV